MDKKSNLKVNEIFSLAIENHKKKNIEKAKNLYNQVLKMDPSHENANINMVIQINGRTRDVLNVVKDISENEIENLIKKNSKAKKYLVDKKIIKTIFVKNKIINYIIKNQWKKYL